MSTSLDDSRPPKFLPICLLPCRVFLTYETKSNMKKQCLSLSSSIYQLVLKINQNKQLTLCKYQLHRQSTNLIPTMCI